MMEPDRMDDTVEFFCRLAVVNRQGGVTEDFSWSSITVRNMSKESTPSEEEPFIIIRSSSTYTVTKYNIIGNIKDIFTKYLNEGRATVCLKEPRCNIIMAKADPDKLTKFITHVMAVLPKDSPLHVSMAAFDSRTYSEDLYFSNQGDYKLQMEKLIDTNTNMDQFTYLNIINCTLELTGDQVPFADAIRNMKNLTTLLLNKIELRSSAFLEVESKEIKKLHLCDCETRFPIASLFKNDLCYKDSLVELNLESNRWSEIPNGIFQFRNLLRLSLVNNFITKLPDMFTNLSKLQELDLSRNQLTHVSSSIFALQNLLKLSLRDNSIVQLPDMFANLSALQELLLSGNRLRHLPLSIFALQNLLKLSLGLNFIAKLPDMFTNLPKLNSLMLFRNRLDYVPPSIFSLQNLSELDLSETGITELPDKFTNLSKLKILLLSYNRLQYLPHSICSLDLRQLNVEVNKFNFEIPPSIGSKVDLHSLKELSYRAILDHELIVEEGMLPEKSLKDLDNYRQCICGRKFVDEGQDLFYYRYVKDISPFNFYKYNTFLRVPLRGKLCSSVESCYTDYFTFR